MQTKLNAVEESVASRRAWHTLAMRPAKLAIVAALSRFLVLLPASWVFWVDRAVGRMTTHMPARVRSRIQIILARVLILARIRAHTTDLEHAYAGWIRLYEQTDETARRVALGHIAHFNHTPLFSILMPVYNPSPQHLRAAIKSVQAQFYPTWELCIADDASTDPAIAEILQEAQALDPRIRISWRETNGHIAAASNTALDLADGSYIALLDHDDLLSPRALYEAASRIVGNPEIDIIYSDEDHINDRGRRSMPYFKPGWNPDLMAGQNLINHLGVYRRALVTKIGGFREGLEGSQDYDLALRAIANSTADRIVHIPQVLYHWRQRGSVRSFSESKMEQCGIAAIRGVTEFLSRNSPGIRVEPVPSAPAWNRVIYPIPRPEPLVSVIIPSRNHADLLARTVDGVLRRTDYPSVEVLIVDNGSDEPAALALLERLSLDARVKILRLPGPFNYSLLNNQAVQDATGSLVLLLNNDIDVIHPGWLREMVSHAIRPEIGAVGAKLLYPDGTIQHGGVTIGMGGVAGHQYLRSPRDDAGYFGQLILARNVMAVTGACLLVRRQTFLEVGGLEEVALPVAFNDIDLCLRLVEKGYRNVWTPHAQLYHHESASRGSDLTGQKAIRFEREYVYMRRRWGHKLDHDPYCNPNLSLHSHGVHLAFPPRDGIAGAPVAA
jgi:glycosyltransferase involved in cell wall biosynthesis